MMRGYEGGSPAPGARPNCYRVVASMQGWRVEINGCVTRPLVSRRAALRLARSLQRERDGLTHQTSRRPVQ